MSVRDTSKEAYIDGYLSGGFSKQEIKIIKYLLDRYPETRNEIAEGTNLAINAVSGRVNTLIKKGALREVGKKECRISSRINHSVTIDDWLKKRLHKQS